jgi:hypothetical protein
MALLRERSWRSRIDAQAPMDGAPAFPRQGRLSAVQQPPRLKLADRIAALATLKPGQLDAGPGDGTVLTFSGRSARRSLTCAPGRWADVHD